MMVGNDIYVRNIILIGTENSSHWPAGSQSASTHATRHLGHKGTSELAWQLQAWWIGAGSLGVQDSMYAYILCIYVLILHIPFTQDQG